jgi:hypothetical protein
VPVDAQKATASVSTSRMGDEHVRHERYNVHDPPFTTRTMAVISRYMYVDDAIHDDDDDDDDGI